MKQKNACAPVELAICQSDLGFTWGCLVDLSEARCPWRPAPPGSADRVMQDELGYPSFPFTFHVSDPTSGWAPTTVMDDVY